MKTTYKTIKLVALVASFFIFSNTTYAEDENPSSVKKTQKHSIGLGLGQTFLMGNFDNKGDDKITLDFLYAYSASYSFDLLLNFHSSSHQLKDREVNLQGFSMSIKGSSYQFDSFAPFYIGGLGFYAPTVIEDGVESERKFSFGFNLGGGADLRLNENYSVGLLAQFHNPFKVDQDIEGVSDVKGYYFKLLMTLFYQF